MTYLFRYWPDLKAHRGLLSLGIVAGVFTGIASGFGAPFFMKVVFAEVFTDTERSRSFLSITLVALQLPGIFLLRGVTGYFNQYWMTQCGIEVLRSIRQKVFNHVQRLPFGFFESQRSGDLISRLVSDTEQVQQAVITATREGIRQPVTALAGLGALVYLSYTEENAVFLVLLLLLTPLIILPVALIGRQLKRRGREVQNALGETSHTFQENLRGMVEVRAFNLEQRQSARFQAVLSEHFRAFMKMTKYDKLNQPIMELEAVTVVSIAFIYAYFYGLSFDLFLSFGIALYFTADAAKKTMRAVNDVQKFQGASDRLDELLSEPAAIDHAPAHNPGQWPDVVAGSVRFDKVDFAYDTQPVFQSLSVTIAPGTFCALVGPSGSGKSTFIKLLTRFYEPRNGEISIDGVSLQSVSAGSLRENIALVPQKPVLFDASVAENIALARPDATPAEIEAAARAAYAHDFISAVPAGYDAQVGEDAIRLSGGQRQRLALARAFLKNASILILDEATSALDAESEKRIQDALVEHARGRTVFVIAHRFSTIQHADRILLFENGAITADGNLAELMQNPTFANLYQQQQLN